MQLCFNTLRLKCRPLARKDFLEFINLVQSDDEIQQYFRFENTVDYLTSLFNQSCIPCGVFSKSTGKLVGYVNGFMYSSQELLVEFFIGEGYRNNHYAFEVLSAYFENCLKKHNFHSFRFDVEPDNIASQHLLEKIGAVRCEEEDFVDDTPEKRHFQVFKFSC